MNLGLGVLESKDFLSGGELGFDRTGKALALKRSLTPQNQSRTLG